NYSDTSGPDSEVRQHLWHICTRASESGTTGNPMIPVSFEPEIRDERAARCARASCLPPVQRADFRAKATRESIGCEYLSIPRFANEGGAKRGEHRKIGATHRDTRSACPAAVLMRLCDPHATEADRNRGRPPLPRRPRRPNEWREPGPSRRV